ncbi:2OG-Fe(II)-dependent halogenase WelO5 family protein [Flavobacterium columnare]|uniref:2OG-Fe(II)-dependent halogenase WelO5 family protein n=1 Tax=Flavobacterium columnare TaxID=996 RepID=UPI004033E0BB
MKVCDLKKKNFSIIEDIEKFEFSNLLNVFDNCNPVYVVRNFLKVDYCDDVKNEFLSILSDTNGGNRSKDFVPVLQIGATQFTKSSTYYLEECESTKKNIDRLIDSIKNSEVREDFLLEKSLEEEFLNRGFIFKPSSFEGKEVNPFTIRQWTNSNDKGLSLLPHEDLSQLNLAKLDGYEIGDVKTVIACNLCLSNSKGGELIIWNIDPDIELKKSLGVENSGYPYPIEMLNDVEHISININPGDLYFINANFIHAVKEIQGNERITLGRFMGFCSDDTIVYWT